MRFRFALSLPALDGHKKPMPAAGYKFLPVPVPTRVPGTRGLPVPDKKANGLGCQPCLLGWAHSDASQSFLH
jgi:hypothetical protein